MIKASSLFYAVIISIIIAIVSSSFILFAYLSRIEFDTQQLQQRMNLNADSGLNLLLSNQSLVELGQPKIIDLFNTGGDSVFLERKQWGAFEILTSRAIFHNLKVERVAQAGFYPDTSNSYSIYLVDEGKPLALCGKTMIKGNVYLPKAGVERAYIEGQNFTGSHLINGAIHKSKNELPAFNTQLIEQIPALLKEKKLTDTDSLFQMQRPLSGDSIHNSFKNNTLVFSSAGPVRISNSTFSGNILILSDTIITVEADAILQDVILAAPKIIFKEEFKGQLQVFASDSIIVQKNCSFHYPSVLGLVSTNSAHHCAIVLNENDSLTGSIFSYQKIIDSYKRAGIRMGEKSVVIGQVYSSGYVELKGSVFGSLMCSKFLLQTPSSVYENHLLNATVDQPALPGYFTGITLLKESAHKKIIKWLD